MHQERDVVVLVILLIINCSQSLKIFIIYFSILINPKVSHHRYWGSEAANKAVAEQGFRFAEVAGAADGFVVAMVAGNLSKRMIDVVLEDARFAQVAPIRWTTA